MISQLFAGLVNFSYGLLNGLQRNNEYAVVVVFGNFLSIILAYLLIVSHGVTGAVISLALPLVLPVLPALYIVFRCGLLRKVSFLSFSSDAVNLSRFTLMLLVSAICFPVVEILVRADIKNAVGVDAVGIWQALIRLSAAYLSFFSVFLS